MYLVLHKNNLVLHKNMFLETMQMLLMNLRKQMKSEWCKSDGKLEWNCEEHHQVSHEKIQMQTIKEFRRGLRKREVSWWESDSVEAHV